LQEINLQTNNKKEMGKVINHNQITYKFNKINARAGWNPLSNDEQNSLIKKGISLIIFVMLLLYLSACGTTTTVTEDNTPPTAVQEAQAWLAEQLDVPVEDIKIVSTEQVEWTDSCFGLGGPAEACAAEITSGWQAIFEVNGEQYEVRFGETGTIARSPQIP